MKQTRYDYFRSLITQALIFLYLVAGSLPVVMATEKYALLVGVSKYPLLASNLQLRGPTNDVVLMKRVLREKGFADHHIQVLAENTRLPTRKNILRALKDLTRRAKSGDFVFLYFSGHGSQQPISAVAQTEPDGLDELFLPRNIGFWDDDFGTVKNAIVDNELAPYMTALRRQGAFTWVVFDSCHSGTMTRGIPKQDIRERRVSPLVLGVPSQAMTISRSRSLSNMQETPLDSSSGRGGYVAFYAAQTTETTPELYLPKDNNLARRFHGLFTYTLAEVLSQNEGITYRQAGELILQRYAAQNYRRPTPLFEGTQLDAPIFGIAQTGKRFSQWSVQRQWNQLKIAGGQIHGLTTGSILAILPTVTAMDKQILGYVKITRTTLSESDIESIYYANKPALSIRKIPKSAYARLVEPNVSLTLRIALPPVVAATPLEMKAQQVLKEIRTSRQNFGVNLTWVSAEADADLHLLLKADQLWLLPPTAEFIESGPHKTHSIRLNTTNLHDKLRDSFQSIAKVLSLLRLSQQIPRSQFAQQVSIRLQLERADNSKTYEANTVPHLYDGDFLKLSVKNQSNSAADVTILFVDNHYGITTMYPAEAGEVNRIEARGKDSLEFEIFADSTGVERLVVIAVEAQPNTMMQNFSFLAQPSLPHTRSYKNPNLYDLFMDAGFGTQRGIGKKRSRFKSSLIKVFSWNIVPEPYVKGKLRKRKR